jgi:dihydroorotate dehydrogenase
MWGIKFRNNICNSAGMFKNGEGYEVCANLGAGAYLGGTSTYNPRKGNSKKNTTLPFMRLNKSKMTVNFLGLPNQGDEVLSKKVYTKNKVYGCPIGWSVMRSPDFTREEGEEKLVKSLFLYKANPQIDFLEVNVSCPNVKKSSSGVLESLNFISESFLKKRSRHLPVVVKLSNDVTEQCLEQILKSLVTLKFDGVNIGNTSTDYSCLSRDIHRDERRIFDTFTSTFSGGVGGRALKARSLYLSKYATQYLKKIKVPQEFHVIRTGGIESHQDLLDSEAAEVSYNQWQTGFFFSYLEHGVNVYKNVLNIH